MTFFVSAGLLARIDLERVTRIVRRSLFADFRDGWREFASRSWLVGMVVGFAIFQLTFFPVLFVLGPYVAKTDLGGPGAWGAILAVESAGAVIGGFAALRVRFTLPLVAMVFLVVPAGLEIVLLGLAAPLWVIAAVAFASGACLAVNSAVWFSTLQEKIPQHAISRVSSFDWFASVAFNPIGYVLVGPLSESIGVGKTLVISGLVNVATTIALLAVPTVRSLHSGPEAEAAAEPG